MPRTTTEQIFAALFALAQTVTGTDWAGNPIALQYFSRNWVKAAETPDGVMPALYQLDPLAESDARTGLGRSRRKLHAELDIRIQRQQPDQYPDVVDPVGNKGPFSTLLNNWSDNLYSLISPADGNPQTLTALQNGQPFAGALKPGAISDCYPTKTAIDFGTDSSRVAIVYMQIEIVTGG
jgi:hypothetical protein